MQKIETRVSRWDELKGAPWSGGLVAYRVWKQFDGMRWFQRHEWKRADGTTEMDAWIRGAEGFSEGSVPA